MKKVKVKRGDWVQFTNNVDGEKRTQIGLVKKVGKNWADVMISFSPLVDDFQHPAKRFLKKDLLAYNFAALDDDKRIIGEVV